jgi:RNA polymerase sigma-70 factor (ECF subfamily)
VTGPQRNSDIINPTPSPPVDEGRWLESCLVAAMAAGDSSALDALYPRLAPAITMFALRITDSQTDAEEVMQDTFVKMWNKAVSYDPKRGHVITWALTIARGLALDRRRKLTRQAGRSVKDAIPTAVAPEGMDQERFTALRGAWAMLSPEEQDCLEQSIFDDLSHSEIAVRRLEALGTVKSRLRRALQKLRQTLLDSPPP